MLWALVVCLLIEKFWPNFSKIKILINLYRARGIKDFNKEEIKLNSDEEEPQVDTSEPSDQEQAQDDEKNNIEDKVKSMADKATKSGDKVDSMAKSAAKRRS